MARIIYKSRQDAEIKSKSGGIEQEEGTDLERTIQEGLTKEIELKLKHTR